jgi:hypothetical protein
LCSIWLFFALSDVSCPLRSFGAGMRGFPPSDAGPSTVLCMRHTVWSLAFSSHWYQCSSFVFRITSTYLFLAWRNSSWIGWVGSVLLRWALFLCFRLARHTFVRFLFHHRRRYGVVYLSSTVRSTVVCRHSSSSSAALSMTSVDVILSLREYLLARRLEFR